MGLPNVHFGRPCLHLVGGKVFSFDTVVVAQMNYFGSFRAVAS